MTFKEKVQSMTAKEIIMAMVDSLTRPPIMNIDMNSYGHTEMRRAPGLLGLFGKKRIECFGCAATNTICKISGLTPKELLIGNYGGCSADIRANNLKVDGSFLDDFEGAINELRGGDWKIYNTYAELGDFAIITNPKRIILPHLYNDYTNEDLVPYRLLADSQ